MLKRLIALFVLLCALPMAATAEAAEQAIVINEMIEIFEELKAPLETEIKLKEFVGHSPVQVLAGVLLGIVNAFVMHAVLF